MKHISTRIGLCLDMAPMVLAAPGWTFIDIVAPDEAVVSAGDCLIVDAGRRELSRAARDGQTAQMPVIAFVGGDSADLALIDRADGILLAGDSAADIGRVLDTATARGGEVRDLSDNAARTIGALGVEASRLAEALQAIAARVMPGEPEPVTAATVRRLIRLRRDRDRFLPALLFADPAWDMLLDLTAARLEMREVPVSSLCIAAAVPTSTALRWIRTLIEAGLFERVTDPTDARRNFVRLTDTGSDGVLGWLRSFTGKWRPA